MEQDSAVCGTLFSSSRTTESQAFAPIEHLFYPILVGHQLKLHNALVFVAVLGGVVAFGLVGLFVGPVILALSLGLRSLWKDRFAAAAGFVGGYK